MPMADQGKLVSKLKKSTEQGLALDLLKKWSVHSKI